MHDWIIPLAAGLLAAAAILASAAAIRRPRARPGAQAGVFTLVAAAGHADGLEAAVREYGTCGPVIIADCGLDEYGRKLAELLARDMGGCTLLRPAELPHVLEEYGWTEISYG